jgi:uncharacterized protein YcbK (DUF882 family)
MKNVRLHLIVIAAGLAVLFGLLALSTSSSLGQSQISKSDSHVKPTVLITKRAGSPGEITSPFVTAAAQNSLLQNELIWTFGGKERRGWYLYSLLIDRTLNIPSQASPTDFASGLSVWQRNRGLNPDGILDEPSFMAMVSVWQNSRLQDRTIAQPDQLLTAPASDFYDPERLDELRQVERSTYAAYKRMVAAAIADPTLHLAHTSPAELAVTEQYFKIISAFRSREYQEQLRRQSPGAGTAGLAINSPHFTGRALDIYVGGDPVDTRDSNRAIQVKTPVYQWLVRNAERFGFRPYFYEPWHWEYVK